MTTNLINDKIYIGAHKTKKPNDGYLGSGVNIKAAIRKYGRSNFKKVILFIFDNSKDMYAMESRIVDTNFIKNQDNYNGVPGGRGGNSIPKELHPNYNKKFSTETKQKMSLAKQGNKHHNFGKTGETMPMYGKKHSDETKERLRKAGLGNKNGKHLSHSIETKLRMSQHRSGELHPLYGSTVSEETKEKIRKSYIESQKMIECPFCGKKSINKANMGRYHFDKCKIKLEELKNG